MEVLTTIAGKIAELTVIPLGNQVGYLFFYKENFKELKDKIEVLKAKKFRIEHDVEAERRNGREIEDDVKSWQQRVEDAFEKVEKLCEDQPQASVRCWKWSFPNLVSRHQLGRKAKKMAFTIAGLEQKKFDGGVGHVPASGIANLTFATPGSEKLESRNSVKKEVMLSLTDPKVSKVGIYGWGGVGKTTLAKEIAKHVEDDKVFDVVVMATISQTLDVERVQDEIAYQLGFHLGEKTSVGRVDRLCARIKMEKNILIILDDLWGKIDLDKLGIPSEKDLKGGKLSLTSKRLDISQKNENYQGCKLLLTSRRLDILQKNETQRNFALQTLNEVESWSLFEDMVGDAIRDANLQKIATQVVERCAGLPVMIVSIAKSLKYNKNIYYWKDVLNNLKRVDSGDMYGTVFSAFEFTYNRLEDDQMKKVFLLCGAYGPSIAISDLLKYVIGLGILNHIDTIEDARNRLYRIIDDLKASCLLLEEDASETDVIKMHDLVREVAVSIAYKNEHVFALKRNEDKIQDWPSEGFLERCTQIILRKSLIQELPQKLECPNLKFFLLNWTDNCTLNIPDSFFDGMRSLEALDLRGLVISSLPRSLFSLTKLKTLCLDQCTLKRMAGISALIDLEILSFVSSSMEEFSSEIGQLTHLRILDLSNSIIEIMPPNILSKLTKLEELYLGNASIKWEEESSTKHNKCASLAELGYLTSLTALEIQIRDSWMLYKDKMFDKLERYKVVIGDIWEWSSNYKRTSRLLKLKLDTSIHWEHGIKALIKRVEDLSLDEVNGISDVLFNLNGEGYPLLKHLHIQNNGQIQHIINTIDRNETQVLFPELETLILHNLNKLVKICHGPLPVNSFGKLTTIKVKSCHQLVYLCSVLMVKALSQLDELQVSECNSMKMIVYIENEDSGITVDDKIEFRSLRSLSLCNLPLIHDFYSNDDLTSCMTTMENLSRTSIPTSLFNHIKVSLSRLETLKLSSINVEKIWDDDHFFAANSFHNLANLIVEDCRGLKHLFSSSLIGSLSKLKHLEISKCEMMEEIIASNSIASQEVRFSKLETMVIKDMKNLKKVWHFEFDGLKTLEVSNCGKLVNIFPYDMQRMCGGLETLKVRDCGSVEEIFELTAKEIDIEDEMTQFSQLKKLHLLGLRKLKQIWSRDHSRAKLHFPNLQLVFVKNCMNLEFLFPFCIAKQAIQLEHITIRNAGSMKQIVSDQKEGILDSPVRFEFNHLSSLVLWDLYELEGVFAGNHSVLCPVLKELDIRQCGKLKLFKTQSTSGKERVFDRKLQISTQQPLFTVEEVICNLEILALNSENASMILQGQGQFSGKQFSKLKFLTLTNFEDAHATFPYWFLQNIATLNELLVECSSFREIFQDDITADDKRKFKIGTRIKALALLQLHDLQHICKEGFPIDPVLEVLEYLWVEHCSNLKHLAPSSVTFSHLTYLLVKNCNGLIHLITSSTARSLVKLTTMKIMNCNSLEQVVAGRDGSEDEIAFSSLEILELECLPMIKRFCSCNCSLNLPLLKEVVVKQCPRMSIFCGRDSSTPKLQKISSKEDDGKVYWEGDLNRTISKMFMDKELQVSQCDSIESVFDVKALDDREMPPKKASWLKKLTLSGLPNLKYIWNKDLPKALSLENFQVVDVVGCQNLKYVFSPSLCQDLRQLEELTIESCGVEQIVANEEGLGELKFSFPRLRIINLIHLTQLKDFYPRRYTLECPSLKVLNVGRCESLQIFAFGHLDSQQLEGVCVDLPIQHALFHIEKVSENLKELSLNEKDTMRILSGNYGKMLFQRTEILRLQYFQETPVKFLNELLERFPAATTLQARWSSFKTLFPIEEISHLIIKNPTQIKRLWLFQLEQLEHIFNDNSASDALVSLEYLTIRECSRLIRLAPPLTSFTNLTTLKVNDCNGLMFFMTSFTAKSLVHLTSLTIRNCWMLEEVVMTNEGGSEDEIRFESLKYLELTCLSRFKSFCFGKHAFIFPSLVTLKVIGCHKMQNFSSGIIVAPFLKLVEMENGRKHWKGDLNTTIKNFFRDKAIREGDEGTYKVSSSDIIKSSQTHQRTASTTGASSSKEQLGQSQPNQVVDIGKQETHKLLSQSYDKEQNEQALLGITQNASSPSTTQDTGLNETIDKPLFQTAQDAQRPIAVQDIEGSHESKTPPRENLSYQPKTFVTSESKEKIHDTMDKTLIQTDQAAKELATAQNTEESRDLYIETQEICDTTKKTQIPAAQNVLNSTMIHEAAVDSSPSQAPESMTSSIQKLNIYRNYKGMIDISEQNMRYLEAGVERHPQVLDWLNTKRRGVFASFYFSLFSEVTRILRTTRRGHLTEDDRNYVRECCSVLQGVGFDASWLSYVYKCIEECGDAKDIKRKVEEAKDQALNLKAQLESIKKELASVEESLVLLLDKANRLDDFIEF